MREFTFGRKINYLPLVISLGIGIIISVFFYTFVNKMEISILFGLLCFMVAVALYAIKLSDTYGYWHINDKQINYYDYRTMGKRIKAILFPFNSKLAVVDIKQVVAASLVIGKKIQVPANIKAAPASAYLVYFYPSAYYLGLKLKDNQEVDLDLSFDEMNNKKIEQMVKLLGTQLNSPVTLIEK